MPLYAEEKSRIYRALCRFEIHRNLFSLLHESGQLKESESQPKHMDGASSGDGRKCMPS